MKVDVSGAYESLPHDKLLEVVGQALSPVQDKLFTIRHYAKIWAESHEGLRKTFVRRVHTHTYKCSHYYLKYMFYRIRFLFKQADFLEDNMGCTNMKGFVMSMQKSNNIHHAILAEQVGVTCIFYMRMCAAFLRLHVSILISLSVSITAQMFEAVRGCSSSPRC